MPQQPLSRDEAEDRILRAIKTVFALSDPDAKFLMPPRAAWPETYDPQDYPPESRARFFEPTPEDVDRYLDDLMWLHVLERADAQLVVSRAMGRSFPTIAEQRGSGSREYWRRRYEQVIDRLHRAANGEPTREKV